MDLNNAIMLMKIKPTNIREAFEDLKARPGVLAHAITTGPYDLVLFLHGEGWDDLFGKIKNIRTIKGLKATVTLPVHNFYGDIPENVCAIVLTRLMKGDVDVVAEKIHSAELVNFSSSVAGPYDIIMTINPCEVTDHMDLKDRLLTDIRVIDEIKDTLTLTTSKNHYSKQA